MKVPVSKNVLITVFYYVFTLALVSIFLNSFIKGFSKEDWNISEFLINYQGGFVRRGLLGEIILNIYTYFGINPYTSILFVSTVAYIFLVAFFIKSFIKKGYTLFIIPFAFLLGNPIINDFWVRKDVLIILLWGIALYFSVKKNSISILLTNLFLIIGLLIHETIAFYGFPILLLILNDNSRESINQKQFTFKSISLSVLQLFPSLITFIAVIYYNGSTEVANKIGESWQYINFPRADVNVMPYAIDGLTWTVKHELTMFMNTLTNFNDAIYAPIAWILILFSIYYVLINMDKLDFAPFNSAITKKINKVNISNLLIFQFFTIAPISILGWDYGRWIFFWTTSSLMITLIVPEKKVAVLFPKIMTNFSSKVNSVLDSQLSKSKGFLYLLCILIGVPGCSWSLDAFIDSNPLIILLRFISKFGI